MTRWVKKPNPGQFRGEGDWQEYFGTDEQWEYLTGTGFLPTHVGDFPPESQEYGVESLEEKEV